MKVRRYKSIYRKNIDPLKVIGAVLISAAVIGLCILAASLVLGSLNGDDTSSDVTSSVTSSEDILNTSSVEEIVEEPSHSRDGAIRAAFLPHSVISNGKIDEFISNAKSEGITDVIITVKDDTGLIYFESDYEPAKFIKNQSETQLNLSEVVKKLHENEINAVAQFHCFSDRIGTRIKNAGVLYSENHNVVWLDNDKALGGKSWLNPYADEAREYLEYLADEVVDLGFDVIMLDSVRFPDGYQLYAYYGKNLPSRDDTLRSFVKNMKTHLTEKETEMWLYASAVSYVDPNSEIFSKNIFALGADTVMFNACPSNFPIKLAFDMTVIDFPVKNPKQTVAALITLAQQKSNNVRLVPVLQGYTNSNISSEYNLEYTKETLDKQFEALKETALTDYAIFSPDGSFLK